MPSNQGKAKLMIIEAEPGLSDFLVAFLRREGPARQVVIATPDPGDIVSTLLRREGHKVSVVANGMEGFEKALQGRPDLIVLDRAAMEATMAELRRAQAQLEALSILLPICSRCKKVRRPDGGWEDIELYLAPLISGEFTHTLCPDHQ
jgi:CheY-like chemotaxis protein